MRLLRDLSVITSYSIHYTKLYELAVFLASSLGNLFTYIVTAIQLGIAHPDPNGGVLLSIEKFMSVFAITQIPLAISEGILTVVVV